jgi:arsenite methyltransferase
MTSEFTAAEINRIHTGIKEKYTKVAAEGASCCFKYPTGREGMTLQGYPQDIMNNFPDEVLADFCGVGNPFSLGPLYPGETVLDIGCGAGVDSLTAAHLVGPGGRVVGIDVTFAMLQRAKAHLVRLGWQHVSFQEAEAEALPFPEAEFDAIISNGVFNLTVNKAKALKEAHRVLKPVGRLLLADMVLVEALPPDRQDQIANWYQ